MGTSTDAVLTYGINLLGPDGEWLVREADEYGGIAVDWLPSTDEDEGVDPAEAVMVRLLAEICGFTETDWRADGYYGRRHAAEMQLGLDLVRHCSDEYSGYILAADEIRVSRGDVQPVDLTRLGALPAENGWDERLVAAVRVLGVTPMLERPAWMLCSWWG